MREISRCTFLWILFLMLPASHVLAQDWPQWAQNPQHTGSVPVTGQSLNVILANTVVDPLVAEETAASGGALLVLYQTPLLDGTDVFMESKAGTFSASSYSKQTWHLNRFVWLGTTLTTVWTFDSDWVPPGSTSDFAEPVFHAVLANGFVYVPGAGGTIFKLNRSDGSVVLRLNPFATIATNTFTVSPLSTDGLGNIYYNVIRVTGSSKTDGFYAHDVVNSWLVKVDANDAITTVSYATLLKQATIIGDAVPGGKDPCKVPFSTSQLPWPPTPDAVPPTAACGSQRAALNVAPAISPTGTIYTVSRAHFNDRYSYLIAVNSNLTGIWAASLRGHLNDGCNDGTLAASVLPNNGQPGGCSAGAHLGVDPATNEAGPGRVSDDASSSPTVTPNGTILFGTFSRYNYGQGHLMQFSSTGQFLGAFGYGWDITPAIYSHSGTFSIVTNNNHFNVGSYCDDAAFCPIDRTTTNPASPEAYFVGELDPNLNVEWLFQNTNNQSCTRQADQSITCFPGASHGFPWGVNAPAVDKNGVIYVNSQDGNLYAVSQGGFLIGAIFQQQALPGTYVPASIGGDGRLYSLNAGQMFVLGQ